LELPALATRRGVARVFVKDESVRPLGNFKSLGGIYAGLRALARAVQAPSIEALLAQERSLDGSTLICASDGNHGLAVAAAAELAGAKAHVYLHQGVSASRAQRLLDRGARVLWVPGTYDDAVDAAQQAAKRPDTLLIADTSDDVSDPVSADILQGYDHLVGEVADQVRAMPGARLTHAFIQAGVGGLAAAVAHGLANRLADPPHLIVVEPKSAQCVAAGLATGNAERIPGNLETSAEMLSCGQASAPALRILRQYGAKALGVDETALEKAVAELVLCGGPDTTPSGAAGVAGLLVACNSAKDFDLFELSKDSQILLIASEGAHCATAARE
jgi:diaminopropionate ammonia-lyase